MRAGDARVGQGSSGGGQFGSASSVFVEGDAVHRQGEADQVDVLAGVANGMGSAEPHGVVEVSVDGLGIVSTRVQLGEVGVVGGDGPHVLGPVEAPFVVLGVAVKSNNATVPFDPTCQCNNAVRRPPVRCSRQFATSDI